MMEGRSVAIKMISLQGLKPQQIIDATDTFNRELHILSELRHRSLPRIYEHFTDADHWYLVMEFIEGETLESLLHAQSGSLPLLEVCHIGIQLCAVLEYLHSRQPAVIFRDLKPANVMVTAFKQVYLIDFGTARLFKPGRSHDTIAFGSPGYAAPEQYGKAQTTARSDIYSLGATLHHLLTGIDPSDAPFDFAPLATLKPSLPDELSLLLLRMLSLDASERPANMNGVKTELQRLAVEHTRRLYPLPGTFSIIPQTASIPKHPYYQPSPTTYYVPSNGSGTSQQIQMQSQVVQPVTQGNFSRRALFVGLISLTVLGAGVLSQSQVWHHVYPTRFSGYHQSHTFDIYKGPVASLAWTASPFNRLASLSSNGTVVVEDALSGRNLTSFVGPNQESVTAIAVMHRPSGASLVALGLNNYSVVLWDGDANFFYQENVSKRFSASIRDLAWSFDDTYLAVAEGDLIHLFLYNAATSELIWTQDFSAHDAPVSCLAWSPDGAWLASGSEDQSVRLWAIGSEDAPRIYQGHQNTILSVSWVQSGSVEFFQGLASCSADGEVRIWQSGPVTSPGVGTFSTLSVLRRLSACSVAWAPDQAILACACQDKGVALWSLEDSYLHMYQRDKSVVSLAWSPDGIWLANGDAQGDVTIWRQDVAE